MLHKDDHTALKISPSAGTERARPMLHQHAGEIQPFGKIAKLSIALDETVCVAGVSYSKVMKQQRLDLPMIVVSLCSSTKAASSISYQASNEDE
jgi:hypothetical protein